MSIVAYSSFISQERISYGIMLVMDNEGFLQLGLYLAAAQVATEFLPYTANMLWKRRTYFAAMSVVLLGISAGFLVYYINWPFAVLLCILQIYRAVNLLRIVKGRLHQNDLRKRALRSSMLLFFITISIAAVQTLYASQALHANSIFAFIIAIQIFVAIFIFLNTIVSLRRMKVPDTRLHLSDSELPTLTIAIPARNETGELTDSLQSQLASDYPKLEILVLDDCSQDSTSDIIRGFAHRGVRFLKGTPPPDDWLAKNYAYQQLLEEANGEIVLFCGVDVRFDKQSLRQLIELFQENNLSMASVLPHRRPELNRHFLLQPMRYWREIALPNFITKTPPSLSTCWLVKREVLHNIGGFKACKRAIHPQNLFARILASEKKYHFFRGSTALGITSVKNLAAQWQTAVRSRYPELHQAIGSVFIWSLFELIVFALPPFLCVYGLAIGNTELWISQLVASMFLIATHLLIVRTTTNTLSISALFNFPLVVVAEVFALNYSMWKYEFSDVMWKGRNVCMPLLRTIPRLPNLP